MEATKRGLDEEVVEVREKLDESFDDITDLHALLIHLGLII